MKDALLKFLSDYSCFQQCQLSAGEIRELAEVIEEEFLTGYLSGFIAEIEQIIEIDPKLDNKTILEVAAKNIAESLHAEAATIRLFDPETFRMNVFGAYRLTEEEMSLSMPFADSLSGRVVKEQKTVAISSIVKDPLYKYKQIRTTRGLNSLLAVPIRIPDFLGTEDHLLGSFQIYYKEDNRHFDAFEIFHAELLARHIGNALGRRKILELQRLNQSKEKISGKIFVELSKQQGIKLKDLFVLLIPELEEFLHVHGCSLFTVSKDQRFIRLEAAYPLDRTYHDVGYTFTVAHHPYFRALIQGTEEPGENEYEVVDPAYLFIKDPVNSRFTSQGLKDFALEEQIHSMLFVPLKVHQTPRYVLAFYAPDRMHNFSKEAIELLTFFGREIMKASRLELLDDVLHDLKNPAIAIGGFCGRARRLLEQGNLEESREKLVRYLDIMANEMQRLQDLALTVTVEGREELVDLSAAATARFQLNEEAIHESRRRNIRVAPPEMEPRLMVYCSLSGLERVLDNLLHNATKAIPEEGGVLSIRSFREGTWACLEIRNSGEIPEAEIERVRTGQVKGRGLNIIQRFVQTNHGKIEIGTNSGHTVITMMIPAYQPE